MLSLKVQYGLRAMVSLAANYGKGALQAKEIASSQNIPARYLELLLSQLRRAQLVNATRGKKGGYYIMKKPNTISVYNVVSAFEGSILFSDDAKEESDSMSFVWREAEKLMVKYLRSLKLSDLVSKLGH